MIRVYVSSVIEASADSVWARIRDFNGLPQWHPLIADSRIENQQPADRVGCVRSFHTRDGGRIREKLLAARRLGLRQVILPAANRREYDEVPESVRRGIRVHFVEQFEEVVALLFG